MKSWFTNLPIKWKLALIMMTSTVVALFIAGAGAFSFLWGAMRARLVRDLTSQARILNRACEERAIFQDPQSAQEILSAVRGHPTIVAATMTHTNGQVFAQFFQNGVTSVPELKAPGHEYRGKLLILKQPIRSGDQVVGFITLVASLVEQRHRSVVFVGIGVGSSLVALLATLLVTNRLQRVFTGPLDALARGAEAVRQQGDYSVRVVAETGDEIGAVTEAFNEMLTQIQQRDAAVRSAEERLRVLVECLPVITYTAEARPVGRWFYVSPQVQELFGYTPAEWLANPKLWFDRVHPDDRSRVIAADEACRQTGRFQADYRLLARDGRVVWCHDEGTLQPGVPPVIQGLILDVTDRQRMVTALRASEERLQSIVDNSTAVIYMKDRTGRYLLINRLFEELFGISRAEVLGKRDHDLFPRDMAEAFRANDLKVLVEQQPMRFDEVAPHADGLHDYLSLKFPISNNGRIEAVCGISTDVTDRRRLERQVLEISDREQARIGQDLHDGLCQHLVATAFACRALATKLEEQWPPLTGEVRKICELIDDAITQGRQLSRGLYPVKLEAEGLAMALEELASNVRHLLNVSCQVVMDAEPVVADSATAIHLYRIAQEAVNNAVRHGRAGNIVIACDRDGSRVTLTVSDDGVGLQEPATRRGGLGLHIMQYRASLISGSLDIRNAPEGGTVVTCTIEVRS